MPSTELPRTLVAVHDVMPATLSRVERIVERLESLQVSPLTLLVVPGTGWDEAGIDKLRDWQARGHELAGHGWVHRIDRFGGLWHRLHGLFISRRVAEHLALDAAGVETLIRRCHDWFGEHGLAAPALYVPPAWAMGSITRARLAELPFRHYEFLSGVLSTEAARFTTIPLTGYEADTRLRAPIIRGWNELNRRRARNLGWLRVSIHPYDPELLLGEDVWRDVQRFTRYCGYDELNAGRG